MSDGRPSATPADLAAFKQGLASNGTPHPTVGGRPKTQDRALYTHAHMGRIRSAAQRRAHEGDPDAFDRLAELAEDEDWDGRDPNFSGEQRILRNYVEWTFERAHLQGKVLTAPDERHSTFNTGLATKEQEDIYGLFEPNRNEGRQPWYLRGWRVGSDRDFLQNFPTPPEPATFTDDPAVYHYDWTRELKVNVRHVMQDNLDRFPRTLQSDPYGLELRLEAAVKRATQRVKRNYKAAVPMWYPKADEVQLLLPLSLTHPHTVDLALVVSRHGEHYRGNTVLTMGMAYSNARLLARPDGDWLQPAADFTDASDAGEHPEA